MFDLKLVIETFKEKFTINMLELHGLRLLSTPLLISTTTTTKPFIPKQIWVG
jgi:hypothetical protein